ncbi:MAG TPA: DUF3422 domain-containing protein [Gammaproteobacteria bacterium]|nr:DUF3422 domain-containing protein [Gammaproteobacteria bacterium]
MNDKPSPKVRIGASEHPLRRTVVMEVHARPFLAIPPPMRLSHMALTRAADNEPDGREQLVSLCRDYDVEPPASGAVFFAADFGTFRLRWERHTEFSTFTVMCPGVDSDPFQHTALQALPEAWLASLPGHLLVAAHVALEDERAAFFDAATMQHLLDSDSLAGSAVAERDAMVWTDFHVHEDGFTRFLVQDRRMGRRRVGRLVQRLLEIETYRLMALLAFPLARETAPELDELERELGTVADRITDAQSLDDEQALLFELSSLATKVEHLSARTTFRLSAASAYYALVNRRTESLREQRLPELQTIGKFMDRRLAPAMRTCQSVSERLESLSERIARAGNLLRTRVDVALEAQNQTLLRSMDRRAHLQLALQETVEGLSVVALSYYGLGLLDYVLGAVEAVGLHPPTRLILGFSLPVVAGAVWFAVHRIRKRLFG